MSDTESEEECVISTPPELREAAKDAAQNALPKKSKQKYVIAYDAFLKWKQSNKAIVSENCLLVYFQGLIAKYKPTTVWSQYSMLKSILKIKENIDISKFYTLNATIKQYSVGYESKKSLVFTENDLKKFLYEAPDETYLANKVRIIYNI